VILGQVLGGFIVAIFFSMLVTSFFPDLSNFSRALILISTTGVFGFALVWEKILYLARRDEARRKGKPWVDVPWRF
jgi:hypothetical protein